MARRDMKEDDRFESPGLRGAAVIAAAFGGVAVDAFAIGALAFGGWR